jgi:diguanylate cyclase (GGDEF)-like protein
MLLGVCFVAYRLGSLIVRPLDRLTGAAAQVTAGNLSVGLPEAGRGEIGYLTQVFNEMVTHLRASRAELERVSTTDALTGLHNRRQLMSMLNEETRRSRRHNRGYTILMADVDLFKKFNDDYGHQAGDEILRRFGGILRESTRATDCAARYGGEEFMVLLSETTGERAMQVAERIRERMREEAFNGTQVTVSIGLAEFPTHGDTPEAVISRADEALYDAKRAGRDRVVRGEAPPGAVAPAAATGSPADQPSGANGGGRKSGASRAAGKKPAPRRKKTS